MRTRTTAIVIASAAACLMLFGAVSQTTLFLKAEAAADEWFHIIWVPAVEAE